MANTIQEDFNSITNSMFEFCNGYTVMVWGCGIAGQFANYLFKRNNKIVDYNLDRNHNVYSQRPYILKNFDPKYTRIIVTFQPNDETESYLSSFGFRKGKEYELLSTWFGKPGMPILGFENWIETFYNLDLTSVPETGTIKINEESHNFHWGAHDYKFMEAFDSILINDSDAVFDYGCGKGGALLLLILAGFRKVGGIEYDDNLYHKAVENLKKMGIDTCGIILGDATSLTNEVDAYNYFFLYDPFEGKQFELMTESILDSFTRNYRKITVVYASPQCDQILREKGGFVLTKRIEADCLEYPGINIYVLE